MKKNEFICQAALDYIKAGFTEYSDAERKARYLADTMEANTKGVFDDSPQEQTQLIRWADGSEFTMEGKHELKLVGPNDINCRVCVNYKVCQKPCKQRGYPCNDFKILVVIAKDF